MESIHVSGSIPPLAAQRLMALKDKLPNMDITAGLGGPEIGTNVPTDQPNKLAARGVQRGSGRGRTE